MKRLNVDINEEQYEELKEIAKEHDVNIATLLGAFVADLSGILSNGSDERDYARQYLDRTWIGINRAFKRNEELRKLREEIKKQQARESSLHRTTV
ncbi:hypothetical protein [Cytobacillus sp.]|uniref:hypothetical protein n=1 Tax=Cytobacillus sp. TaxID=2675269 RepID=UPI0028BEF2BE|nr:hypothetical protein [Cytobacillus sp.]